MVEIILFIPLIVSFAVTFLMIPKWIQRIKRAEIVGKDMNKYGHPEIPEIGGVVVLAGFMIGVFLYIALQTFYFKAINNLVQIFALLSVIFIVSFIGFIDDILGWKIGLNKKMRVLLILFASMPLIVINAGHSEIFLPFFGVVNLGLFYPLLFIPFGVIGTSVTFNFLAGYNGLEASQGIIILSALAIVAWLTGVSWLSVILFIMVFALAAFYLFNRYPAKIFPGNILTYAVGSLIAISAIIGNIERIAIFFFIPYIIEVGLKLRGGLKRESFAKPNKDGSLDLLYDKFYGLEHIALYILKKLKGKAYEQDIVIIINAFQLIIIIAGFFIFKQYLFIP